MFSAGDHVVDHVDAYLHGALSAGQSEYVRTHCEKCRICQVALEEAQNRFQAMYALPVVEASEQLIQKTVGQLEKAPRWKLTWGQKSWLTAAAVALLLAAVNLYCLTRRPSPYDLRILGQTAWMAGSDASLRVLLVDHHSRRGVEGVPVQVTLGGGPSGEVLQLASFTTNRFGSGTPAMHLPDWQDGEYLLQVRADSGGKDEIISRKISLQRSWQLMLSTDKPVYQPGQVIRVRSLALRRADLKPVAGHEVTFSISDPKGNVIFRRRDVTSRFGIASIHCPLAREILEGPYQVQCRVGSTSSELTVEVQKYVLPKFKIGVELDQPYYQPGGRVRGTVQVDYFFGKPVDAAEVRLDVRAVEIGPTTIHQQTLRTEADGSAAFEFDLPDTLVGRPQDEGDARIALLFTVRDSAGQKQHKSLSRLVTAQPIRVEVIPESGRLVRGVPNTIYLFTSYPDGKPAPARIVVSGVERELRTSRLGVASFELTAEEESVRLTVRATDEQGQSGRRTVTLTCGRVADDFLVRTDKAVYDGGQSVHVLALGGGVEPVFIDLIKDGQTMLTDAIEMKDGRGQYQFDLPPELFGTIELCAYRYGRDGLPVRKSRVIYVRQAGELRIETSLDRQQYRPGDRAKLTFRLTDNDGKPVPGALSLAAVDEAVFSVLGQQPGMQDTFFTLEQELLEPIYAVYAWSPDLFSAAPPKDREQFEQALFARTALGRGDRDAFLTRLINDYCGGDTSLLNVLQRPDWEELAQRMEMPEELLSLLRNERTLYSLRASTFPAKEQEARAVRRRRIEALKVAWTLFGVAAGLGLLITLCRESWAGCLVAILIGACLIALMLPAVQSAREASRRSSAMNDLRQIGLGFQNAEAVGGEMAPDGSQAPATAAPPRVRRRFPETLLWRPELITDDQGRASIELDLADSITTWRLSASAVSAGGQLGGSREAIRVFQPFFVELNLPVALTRGDEVAVPVVVYNYLDKTQTVELKLTRAEWFELLDEDTRTLELEPGEVRSTSFRIRAKRVGDYKLRVDAQGKVAVGDDAESVADAIERAVAVVPDGSRLEKVHNGNLLQPAEIDSAVPDRAIENSARAIVKIYPSGFSQLVEGLDAIFQRPYGCFEQASSTTYPNILALDYLRQTGKSVPEVEAKARQYVHLGYQRLISFEVSGGGFDWFGRPPANRTLTAYGLMEFEDMAKVYDVDPRLIERTRRWLLAQRRADGSWEPEGHAMHDDPAHRSDLARLATTAYIAWAALGVGGDSVGAVGGDSVGAVGGDSVGAVGGDSVGDARPTLDYLLAHEPATIDDPYTLALVCNALSAIDASGRSARPYLQRLDTMKQISADGKLVWWAQGADRRTEFYGSGRSGDIETTALAALAMMAAGDNPGATRGALAWLIRQKDGQGTWHSTQATVLALKALLTGTGKRLGTEQQRRIEIAVDGEVVRELTIPPDQAEVVQQIDLTGTLGRGSHRLTLSEHSDTAAGYQFVLSYYVPEKAPQAADRQPLSIEVLYDKTELEVNDTVTATATLVNNMATAAPMVILDLPIPAGFAIVAGDLAEAVAAGKIAKFQLTPRSGIVYLRELPPGSPLELRYGLRATMAVKVTMAPVRAYEYYDPDVKVASARVLLTVN